MRLMSRRSPRVSVGVEGVGPPSVKCLARHRHLGISFTEVRAQPRVASRRLGTAQTSNQSTVRCWIDRDGLLQEPEQRCSAMVRSAPIEPECELTEVYLPMRRPIRGDRGATARGVSHDLVLPQAGQK